jgi:transposase-like protein
MKCPHCGSEDVVKTAYGERWKCKKCGQLFRTFEAKEAEKK